VLADQRLYWEADHRAVIGKVWHYSELAVEVASLLAPRSRVLELGCGTGEDAAYFAGLGHQTLGLDFAETATEEARRRHAGVAKVSFSTHDIAQPIEVHDASFELVYARLSLHYFSDAVTRAIFREVHRVLAPGGIVAFMCKSTSDRLYGRGTELEPDMFDSDHVRHFFSLDYAKDCLKDDVEVISLREERGELYGKESAYVIAIARRA
jgi:SAM-dependent methyltransferase